MNSDQLSRREILEHTLEFIARIEEVSHEQFLSIPLIQDGVYYNLLKIGEAAADMLRLYPEYTDANPQVPFAEARGLRNRLAHDYRYIDPMRIWATIINYLPEFKRALQEALANEPLD